MESLHRAAREGRLAHALLMTGGSESGLKVAAINLAQHLVCDQHASRDTPCGQCGACLRMDSGQSESLIRVEPENGAGKNGTIKIDQVRPVREALSLESWDDSRVIMIEHADTLNPQASNAILKVLEEPPPRSYFFLLTRQPSLILSTIRSRCQLVRGVSLDRDQSLADRMEESGDLARSSLVWWRDIAEGRKVQDDSWREIVRDREQALESVEIWANLLHQSRRLAAGLNLQWHLAESVVKKLAAHPEAVERTWSTLLDLKSEIEAQVDKQLAVESFWLKARDSFGGGARVD